MANRELLRIKGDCWTLTVFSATALKQLAKAKKLVESLDKCDKAYRISGCPTQPEVHLLDPVKMELVNVVVDRSGHGWDCKGTPLFFDNGRAVVEIEFDSTVQEASVFHMAENVADSFVFVKSSQGVRLQGGLAFGNDLGQFCLQWHWTSGGQFHRASLEFTVFSTKLDLETDFKRMFDSVRKVGFIQMDLLRQTHWSLARDNAPATLQTWMSVYRQIEEELYKGYGLLTFRYRQRLRPQVYHVTAERMRRIHPSQEDEIKRWENENPQKRHRHELHVLDPDTMENRFAKSVLGEVIGELGKLARVLEDREGVSQVFLEWLAKQQARWKAMAAHDFWKPIGEFQGWRQESLVLTRDPVYHKILVSWKALRKGLRFASLEDFAGGMQSVDQLYEVWCLLQLRDIIQNLGWKMKGDMKWENQPYRWDDLRNEPGRSKGTFTFLPETDENKGLKLYLLFQPSAGSSPSRSEGWQDLAALPVVQNPDIVLRLESPSKPVRTWIFDCKYRVDLENETKDCTKAPADAIDQMHRYRDAILLTRPSLSLEPCNTSEYQRETIGAFVLFPGRHPYWTAHIQHLSIDKVNIGAFPLHPGTDADLAQSSTLYRYLEQRIGLYASIPKRYWDVQTPLSKGTMEIPGEAQILYGPMPKGGVDGIYSIPAHVILSIQERGHSLRNMTHVALRDTAAPQKSKMVFALKGIERDRSGNKDEFRFLLGDPISWELTFTPGMPEYGVMAWIADTLQPSLPFP